MEESLDEETFHPFHSFALGHYARQREGKVEGRKRVNQRVFLGESIRRLVTPSIQHPRHEIDGVRKEK